MKGIILAGGSGTRLSPMTNSISKQLLPIYDKPMIFYSLANLMSIGIKDILIISTPRDIPAIKELLGNGNDLGISINYKIQNKPNGIAECFIIGEEFINNSPCCLILGDNIFYGEGMGANRKGQDLQPALQLKTGAYILTYRVSNPQDYGVAEFDKNNKVITLEEKPKQPKSNWAVTGLYFYDKQICDVAKNIKPSNRGELEITDVNKEYLKNDQLSVIKLGRGVAWLDAGTPESLLDCSNFVANIEKRQGLKIACLEEIAYLRGYINDSQFC